MPTREPPSGEYVSVVTIPENFSKAATSTAGAASDATQATIDVRTSPESKLVDPAISQAVTTTATSVLNKQLTSTYIENVYVGFNTLGEQLGKAATGADQLTGGLTQLASGTHQLADGAAQLATGASSLAGGISQLSDGTSGLASGLQQLSASGPALTRARSSSRAQPQPRRRLSRPRPPRSMPPQRRTARRPSSIRNSPHSARHSAISW